MDLKGDIMTLSRTQILLVAVGVCALGFWTLVLNRRASVLELRTEDLLEDREVPLGPARIGAPRSSGERAPAEPNQDFPAATEIADEEEPSAEGVGADTANIQVYVYEDETGNAVTGAEVSFTQFPREARIDRVSGATAADGGCIIAYDPDLWQEGEMYTASVVSPGDIQVFHGVVPFRDGATLLTASIDSLRGTIRLAPGVGAGSEFDYSGLQVTIVVHTDDRNQPARHFGTTNATSDGSYEIHGVLRNLPDSATVIVRGEVLDASVNVSLDTELGILRSEDGATHYLPLQLLDFLVRSESGPLSGADVVVRTIPATAHPSQVRLTTNERGAASYLLEPGLVEYCVAKVGYGRQLGTHEVQENTAARKAVDLHLLGPEDVISGEVRTHDGEPVMDALVVCAAMSREDSFLPASSYTRCTSGEDGAFVLAAPEGQPVVLSAFRKDLGLTPQSRIVASPNAHVVIYFDASAELVLSLRSDDAGLPTHDLQTEWYLVDRNRQLAQVIHTNLLPTVFRIPPGSYNLLARSEGGKLYGADSFELAPGEVVHSSITLAPAVVVRGLLLAHNGRPLAGVLVRALHPAWSLDVASSWGQCTTGEDGSFELFCGDLQALDVEFSLAGDALTRRRLEYTEENTVILSNEEN